ncbi:MAG TPA: hypothetical protein VGR85_09300 [Candidatus Limnocylindria bacterium]|jgi:hypothetical protein|nr:hypothetical protein [Candidatus Limnocylindria bacterium]
MTARLEGKLMAKQSTISGSTSQAIDILRKAYANAKTRGAVVRDPKGYLAKHGAALGDEVEVRIYERAGGGRKPRAGAPAEHDLDVPVFAEIQNIWQVPSGLQRWWESTHEGCPFGTYPYKTTTWTEECVSWGLFATGKDWVSAAEGTPFGHWELTGVTPFCLLSVKKATVTTTCLPAQSIAQ